MRFSILLRTVLAIDALVVGASLFVGWQGARTARSAVRKYRVEQTAYNTASLVGKLNLPLSDVLAGRLGEIVEAGVVFIETVGDRHRLLGASVSSAMRAKVESLLPDLAVKKTISVDNDTYEVASAQIDRRGGAAESRTGRLRLFVLVPTERINAAAARSTRRMAIVTLLAAGVATVLALVLAVTVSGPIRNLARRMDRVAFEQTGTLADTGKKIQSSPGGGPSETVRLAESFNRLLERLGEAQKQLAASQRLAALGRISASVVHEIANPLSGVKMNVRILQDDNLNSSQRKLLEAISDEIRRLETYLGELSQLARGRGAAVPRRATIGPALPAEVVNSTMTVLKGKCARAGINVSIDCGGAPPVAADPDVIRQVIMNLVINAIEAMGGGGDLTIVARPVDDRVRLEVRDTGGGVDVPRGEDIFESFTTTKPHGTGLGLYIAAGIIRQHGGVIGYDTSDNGSVFYFELPAHRGRDAGTQDA